VLGGGLPVGAFAGAEAVMSELAPLGSVYQAGTLSGNPVAMAAGLAVLEAVRPEDYDELAVRVERLASGLERALCAAGVAACVPRFASLCSPLLAAGAVAPAAPRNADEVRSINSSGRYGPFFHAMLGRGVAFAPGAFEVAFCSLAHDDAVIDRTIEAAHEAALDLVRNGG
jgi:glutamate-1-semialdehyde 2,1-aminomutase